MRAMTAIATLSLTTLLLAAGCRSGNPQPPPAQHAQQHAQQGHHEHGAGCSCGGHAAATGAAAEGAPISFAAAPAVGTPARCPVSKETFTVNEGTTRSEHGGRHYAFCCAGCKTKFDANPGAFAGE